MKDYNEIIEDQKSLSNKYQETQSNKSDKLADRKWFNKVLGVFLNSIKQFTYSVKVTNEKDLEPAIREVEKAVKSIPKATIVDPRPEIKALLEAIKKLDLIVNVPKVEIPDNKKELLSIEKAVKGIKIPEVKIPAFPKIPEVDFSVLVKEIKKLEKALEVGSTNSDKKTQQRASELVSELNGGLATLAESLKRIEEKEYPQPDDRTDDILKGLKTVSETIQNIRFPVPHVPTQNIVDAIENMSVSVDVSTLATETTLESIKSTDGIKKITDPIKIEHLSGTGVDTSYTLTNAGTAYYIPRTPPTARYTLIVYNGSDTDMMLGFSSTTTVGFKLVPGEKFMIDLDASELIYAYCASAGKVINFSYKEVV